jgi:hypothetical protein
MFKGSLLCLHVTVLSSSLVAIQYDHSVISAPLLFSNIRLNKDYLSMQAPSCF